MTPARTLPPNYNQIRAKMREMFKAASKPCQRTTFEDFERFANETRGGFRNWFKLYKQAERALR
jgi:hypothetical protein